MKKYLLCLALISVAMFMIPVCSFAQSWENIYFSTEEDFLAETEQGLQIVSDGDLLHWSGFVYMKNKELVQKFDERNDLGLDAVDVVESGARIVAFSTELDSTHKIFTAGALLSTNGALITNAALLCKWTFPEPQTDLGLDAVQFKGDQSDILQFLDYVSAQGWDYYRNDPCRLADDLHEFRIDIWFSTEGTPSYPEDPMFLDGDLLSARDGVIVAGNKDLLIPPCPAGLPDRGVDFGLDAFMGPRLFEDDRMWFSTEILFNDKETPFTDGDLLIKGSLVIVLPNIQFIQSFNPRVDFLGLDAVSHFEK